MVAKKPLNALRRKWTKVVRYLSGFRDVSFSENQLDLIVSSNIENRGVQRRKKTYRREMWDRGRINSHDEKY